MTFLSHVNEDLSNVLDCSLGDPLDLEFRELDGKEEVQFPKDLR